MVGRQQRLEHVERKDPKAVWFLIYTLSTFYTAIYFFDFIGSLLLKFMPFVTRHRFESAVALGRRRMFPRGSTRPIRPIYAKL
jgi:hypothetical protein